MINSKKTRFNFILYSLLLPGILFYFFILVLPEITSLPFSLYKWSGISNALFIGLKNFKFLFKDVIFYKSLINSIILIVECNTILLVVGFILAVLLRRRFIGNDIFKTIIFLPIVIAPMLAALTWRFMLDPDLGLINNVLKKIHLDFLALKWIGSGYLSVFAIGIVLCWCTLGVDVVIMLAGARGIPEDFFEVAEIDGASSFKKAVFITLPMIREQIFICIVLNTMGAFKVFEIVYYLTAGGPAHKTELLSTYMYKVGFGNYNYGYGSAISVITIIIGLLLAFITLRLIREKNTN